MTTTPFSGFNGQVWSVAIASLDYLQGVIAATKDYSTIEPTIRATMQTLLNGVDLINAFNLYNSWQIELNNFDKIINLPLAFSANSQIIAQNRRNTYASAFETIGFNITLPQLANVQNSLKFGQPAIPDPGLLNFCNNFNFEPAPDGLSPDNFQAAAQSIANGFIGLANIIKAAQGRFLTQAYDAAIRQQNLTQIQANLIAEFTSGEVANVEIGVGTAHDIRYIWNQLVVLPALLRNAEMLGNAPFLESTQQAIVQRFVLLTQAQRLASFLLAIKRPLITNIKLVTVGNGQSLMDIAARKLQNFEDWQKIAATNKLQPPWIVPKSNDPRVAEWGQQLLLPGSDPSSDGLPPSYLNNFLGVDIYFGPLSSEMGTWSGDFQTIAGYQNLQISIARRLLTAIGSLIYHGTFGSEIPLLIGTIATTGEAGYITALAQAAILTDPRVKEVLNAFTQVLPNFAFGYTGTIIPQGPEVRRGLQGPTLIQLTLPGGINSITSVGSLSGPTATQPGPAPAPSPQPSPFPSVFTSDFTSDFS